MGFEPTPLKSGLGSGRTCLVEHITFPSLGYLFLGISVVVGDRASTGRAPPIHMHASFQSFSALLLSACQIDGQGLRKIEQPKESLTLLSLSSFSCSSHPRVLGAGRSIRRLSPQPRNRLTNQPNTMDRRTGPRLDHRPTNQLTARLISIFHEKDEREKEVKKAKNKVKEKKAKEKDQSVGQLVSRLI